MKPGVGTAEHTARFLIAAGAALLCVAAQSFAIKGVLILKADNRRMAGDIRWQQASKQYVITAGGVTMTLKPSQVKEIIIDKKPAGFDEAVRAVRAKKYAAALTGLEEIMRTYQMLQWDVPATRYAAEAYLGMKDADKAILLCQKLIRDNPSAAYKGQVASIYWKALVEGKREATLRRILDKAVEEGSRELAALAQVRRGDIDMRNGRFRDALVDGYLRVIVLFAQVKHLVPEALYKAAQCFERLNESANAEEMRKRLLAEFPQSKYSRLVKMGK